MMDTINAILSGLDSAQWLPSLPELLSHLGTLLRILVMAGPVCLLVCGLMFRFAPPAEANHRYGYRFFWGQASVESWQFAQKLAGTVWTVLGIGMTAVMAFLTGGYSELGPEEMLWAALWAIVWEIGIAAVSILAINITIMIRYDFKGYPRRKPREESAEESQ